MQPIDPNCIISYLILSQWQNIFAQIPKRICPNCQMYLSKLPNVFVQIAQCICPNCKMYLGRRCEAACYDLSYESHFVLQRSRHKSRHHRHTNNQQNYCTTSNEKANSISKLLTSKEKANSILDRLQINCLRPSCSPGGINSLLD